MKAIVLMAAATVMSGALLASSPAIALPHTPIVEGANGPKSIAIASKKEVRRSPKKGSSPQNRRIYRETESGEDGMAGVARDILPGLFGFGGGGGGGCAVDYTTPNPTGCRVSRYPGPSAEPAYRPEKQRKRPKQSAKGSSTYTCFDGPNKYQTKTYKLGCYLSDYDKPGTRPSDGLRQIK